MTVSHLGRVWRVSWNELARKVTVFQVSTDHYGNSILNKKIKTITPESDDYPNIRDAKSFLEASLSLVEKLSSKSTEPEYFIGTK